MVRLLPFLALLLLPAAASGFAAKKKGGGGAKAKKRGASTRKGFGVAPPTYDQIVAGLRTRVPGEAPEAQECPCGSGKTYGHCCRPYHLGDALPQGPGEVLRTRYSAFAYRLPAYIIGTTHPECADWREDRIEWVKDLDKAGMFDSFDFVGLDLGPDEPGEGSNEHDEEGFVQFRVRMETRRSVDGKRAGQETSISERSRFLRDGDPLCWRYAGGEVRSDVEGIEDVVLNK